LLKASPRALRNVAPVAGGCNDAALGRVADRDRPSLKIRIVALFDGRIEGVHIDVG
jgi:hypothetical protein